MSPSLSGYPCLPALKKRNTFHLVLLRIFPRTKSLLVSLSVPVYNFLSYRNSLVYKDGCTSCFLPADYVESKFRTAIIQPTKMAFALLSCLGACVLAGANDPLLSCGDARYYASKVDDAFDDMNLD